MKINKNKRIGKYVIVTIVAVVLVAGYLASAAIAKWYPFQAQTTSEQKDSPKKVNDVNYDTPSSEEQKAGNEAKQQAEEAPSVYKPAPAKSAPQLAITSANQQNGVLEIRTTLSTIDESGKCSLVFSRSGSVSVNQQVGIQSMGSYSVCKGFDIPTSGLAKGDWNATITYSGASPSATVTQTIKVQ